MTQTLKTQVAIIGGGPAGLMLAQLLEKRGIDSIVIERRTKTHVLSRIRAGVIERGVLELMQEAGISDRMERQGIRHEGTQIAYGDEMFRIDFQALTGHSVIVYGQTELTKDLYEAREASGGRIEFEAENASIHRADSDQPYVTYSKHGAVCRIDCDFIAGCDGFHGVSRRAIPDSIRRDYARVYPFGWLGVLSETPPVHDELVYSNSHAGFALCSMRSAKLSRYYIQCDLSDSTDNWSDDAFWAELKRRIPKAQAEKLITGPSIEMSIAPLRSFVCEPMRYGRLFLCGDAAHIVPPTGAKGLNTAASDVHYLYHALIQHYKAQNDEGLERYSERALARVWKVERFSWWFSSLLHRFPDQSPFDEKIQIAELEFLRSNEDAQRAMAANYVGLPY